MYDITLKNRVKGIWGNSRHAVFGTRESDQIGEFGSAFFGMIEQKQFNE